MEGLFDLSKTTFTKFVHKDIYPAIDPTRPELSQRGRNVLITGGGTNLGLAIAHAFLRAAANTIIITGRRDEVLAEAKVALEQEARNVGAKTRIITRACDVADPSQVDALWRELNNDLALVVDVFVANAARPPQPKSILESGAEDIWAQMETNVKGPLYMVEKLCAQPDTRQKVSA